MAQDRAGLVLTRKAPNPTCFAVFLPIPEGKHSLSGSASTTVITEQRKLQRNNSLSDSDLEVWMG